MIRKYLKNPSAGNILEHEFLRPLGLSQRELAKRIKVPQNRISDIVRGRRQITADTDARLCHYFGFSPGFFLRIQVSWAEREAARTLKKELEQIKPHKAYL